MPAPIYVGPIVTPNNPPTNFVNILDYRAGIGGGGVYDSLMGGFVPDLNTVDIGVSGSIGTEEDAAAAQEAIIQDYVDSLLADRLTPMKPLTPEQRAAAEQAIKEGLRGFEFDPNKDKSAPQQLQEFLGNVNDTFRELTRDGVIRPEQAAQFIEGMLEAEGVTNKSGGAVSIDPSDWINKGIDYGTRTGANGALAYPDLTSLDSGGAPSAADVLGGVGSVIGSILTGGSSGSSGSGDSGSNGSTAPSTPTAPATGGNTGATDGTGVSGNEGVGTGGGYLGGANGTNPDGTPIMEGTGPISVRTPEQQWQDILNDPTMDVAGAVAAAELIFGNSPEGVAAVVDAANARGVSAEDIANSSDYSLSDIIAAANATGKVFTRETNTPPIVPPAPTEVIPPDPVVTPPPVAPAGFEGETGAEVAPPVIVPPAPPQEVVPPAPVVTPPPLQQPSFEGETGSEAAPGSVDATDPTVPDPGDTGGGDDSTGNEGDGTGDGDGTGNGTGDGINIDLGGLFGAITPTPITDSIFAPEKVKFNRLPLDITNTLFGGFRR